MRTLTVTLMCSAALGLAAAANASAATVYKWVDEKGVVHYSDQPHPDAQTVDVKSAQTYSAPPPAQTQPTSMNSQRSAETVAYSKCELYRPENDEVFLNTDTVTAKVRAEPELRGSDRVMLVLDGKRQRDQPPSGTDFTLKVERGTHSLTMVIEDQDGKTMCTSSPVTFHVRQPSVQAPNRANRPRF